MITQLELTFFQLVIERCQEFLNNLDDSQQDEENTSERIYLAYCQGISDCCYTLATKSHKK